MADQHLKPGLREGKPCPLEYGHVLLAERFGQWPWSIEDEPADRVLFYRRILGAEAQVHNALEGLPRTERLIRDE